MDDETDFNDWLSQSTDTNDDNLPFATANTDYRVMVMSMFVRGGTKTRQTYLS